MRFVRTSILVGALLALAVPASAQSDNGPWMVRLRALSLTPANKSDAIPSLGVAADKITVSSKVFPEVDFVRFLGDNFAVELVLTYPQQHDVKLNDNKVGTFKHLPPTLLAQYHFRPTAKCRPYIGAGINYTLISSVDILVPAVGQLELEDSSVGYALQVGTDVKVGTGKFFNVDIKKVAIGSDVTKNGTKVSAVKIDPWLISLGYGIRF